MNGYTPTSQMPANLLKIGAPCLYEGAAYRCIRRASTIHLADVQTGIVREVSGTTPVTRAIPSDRPGVILGHAPGSETTVGALLAGALVIVESAGRWELGRVSPAVLTRRGWRGRNFRVATPWQRSPSRVCVRLDAPCWLAVQVADVPLEPARVKPPPVKRERPSRALGRAPWREPPREKKPAPAVQPPRVVVARSEPIVDVPPPPPPPRVVAPVSEGAREWWTLHRTTKRGQQETLLFTEWKDADTYVRTRGLERVPTRLRGNIRTEATEDGLLRAYLPPPSFQGKPIPPRKVRLPYKDDDDSED